MTLELAAYVFAVAAIVALMALSKRKRKLRSPGIGGGGNTKPDERSQLK